MCLITVVASGGTTVFCALSMWSEPSKRLLHQDKVEYVYGRNVSKCLKQHQRNSTIWQRSVSSCLFTRFSQSDKSNERNLKVQPWILTWLSSVAFAFSCTGSLIVFSSVTHFFFLSFVNEYFLSAFCFCLRVASVLTVTHPWLFSGSVVVIFMQQL